MRKFLKVTGIILLVLVLFVIVFNNIELRPIPQEVFRPSTNPYATFEQSAKKIEEIKKNEENVTDLCKSIFLHHGKKVEKTVVYFHGYTNCAGSYSEVAKMLYEDGYNVYVPTLPYHGNQDRMTEDLKNQTAEELIKFANDSVDIAQGLGNEVTVTGISGGGVMASYIAQTRKDVEKVVPIAPVFGYWPPIVPDTFATNLFLVLPNMFLWWSPQLKEDLPPPYYSYPRYATRGLGELTRIGNAVRKDALEAPFLAKITHTIANENDKSVDLKRIIDIVSRWAELQKTATFFYIFPVELGLDHNAIEPQVENNVKNFYPKYYQILTE